MNFSNSIEPHQQGLVENIMPINNDFQAMDDGFSSDTDFTPEFINSASSSNNNNIIITPPSSTIRKKKLISSKLSSVNDSLSKGKRPISPSRSSPILATKAKKQRSEGCSRVNGNISLQDVIKSLSKRRQEGQFYEKPPYSYAILICLSILQSKDGKLTLSQIYHWISSHFPFFQLKDASWQNSIRHNLSLNDGFIKTAKSSDGKGHFWQVKESSAKKFFKHESRSYEEIREILIDLESCFSGNILQNGDINNNQDRNSENNASNKLNDLLSKNTNRKLLSTKKITEQKLFQVKDFSHIRNDTSIENMDMDVIEHSTPPVIAISSPPSFQQKDIQKNDEQELFMLKSPSNFLEPPYLLRRNHTTIGLQTINGNTSTFSTDYSVMHDLYPNQSMTTNSNSNNNLIHSPHNVKRYICSFNSSFETSPRSSKLDIGTHISSITSSLSVDDVNDPSSVDQLSVKNHSSHHNHDLLRTPDLRESHGSERTPTQFSNTPKDSVNDPLMKKWQTPSHLFEDIYSSPILRAMGGGKTPGKIMSTPGGSLMRSFSPRKLSAPDIGGTQNNVVKSKLPCNGLFGVDVYSVWQRALKDVNVSKQHKTAVDNNKNEKLDLPFLPR